MMSHNFHDETFGNIGVDLHKLTKLGTKSIFLKQAPIFVTSNTCVYDIKISFIIWAIHKWC